VMRYKIMMKQSRYLRVTM